MLITLVLLKAWHQEASFPRSIWERAYLAFT